MDLANLLLDVLYALLDTCRGLAGISSILFISKAKQL